MRALGLRSQLSSQVHGTGGPLAADGRHHWDRCLSAFDKEIRNRGKKYCIDRFHDFSNLIIFFGAIDNISPGKQQQL